MPMHRCTGQFQGKDAFYSNQEFELRESVKVSWVGVRDRVVCECCVYGVRVWVLWVLSPIPIRHTCAYSGCRPQSNVVSW